MRRVVGGDDLNRPVQQSFPQPFIVGRGFDGWVHFDARSEALVIIDVEEQMMEAVPVAAAIKSGALLVNSVQMMNHVKKKSM